MSDGLAGAGSRPMMTRDAAIARLTAVGAPYELIEVDVDGRSCRWFAEAPDTLRDLYADARSAAEFLVYGDERITYEQAWSRAGAIAHLLIDGYDVAPGDRVAISMRNYPEWALSFMAITSIGAVAVALNAHWQPDEMLYGLEDSGAKVLFADRERIDVLARCDHLPAGMGILAVRADELPVAGARHLGEALIGRTRAMPDVPSGADDLATILYTSGSTGRPKGAVSTHRNVLAAIMSWEFDAEVGRLALGVGQAEPSPQPSALLGVPLFHVTGSHAVFLQAFREQRRVVSMFRWDVAVAAELIEREHIDRFVAPAAMSGDLVEYARGSDRDLSSLAAIGGGGAPRAPEQVRVIDDELGDAAPITGWGMTETNAIGTGIAGPAYVERPESSGRASILLDLRVVDGVGNEQPTGERGELLVRGTSVIAGYWNRPDANADTFADGWLRTGDVAFLDDEGFLFIVDRIKDLVIRGGENIGCGAVEAALLEHPAVVEASVYGVPDHRLGEEVGATVFARGHVDADDLRAFLSDRLARFEVPRFVTIETDPLPRTASGKILKRSLRVAAVERNER
jgi:long-chain acyl-CoA synthetase